MVIEIESEIVDLKGMNYQDALTVQSKLKIPGKDTGFTNIRPSLVDIDGKKVLYHYLVYDLCHVDPETSIEMMIKSNGGEF